MADEAKHVAQLVHRHTRILREKVAGVENFAAVGIDQRIVVCAVGLDLDPARRLRERVDHGSEKLRQAAQRVTVLDQLARALSPVAAAFVADDLRAGEQLSHARRRPNLSRMRFHGMDEGLETLVCRHQRLREQRMDGEREARQIERAARRRWRRLPCRRRAVVEGEALLGLERQRRVAEPCQRGMTVERLAAQVDKVSLVETQDRAGDVGERNQIAGGADRAALIDVRMRLGVEEGDQSLDELEPHARGALDERIGAQQHRRAHVGLGKAGAGRALVMPERDLLQLDELLGRHARIRHPAIQES